MNVMATAFKRFFGKVKKITKKEVRVADNFLTPGCLVFPIPTGTAYYKIVLEKGALKKTLTVKGSETMKSEVKLTFFETWGKEQDLEKEVAVGKKYCFSVQSWQQGYWINKWEKLNNNEWKNNLLRVN